MTLDAALAFALGMTLLALVPGPGIATVVSRTLHAGRTAGFAVTAGLMIGDFTFLGLAIVGLASLAKTLGPGFELVRYAGAAYLIWLGWKAFTAPPRAIDLAAATTATPWKDIMLGLLVTLGNPKPIFFYSALVPTFLDVTTVSFTDYLILASIVVVVSLIVLGGYILLAARARHLLSSPNALQWLNRMTGGVLIGSGIVVATR